MRTRSQEDLERASWLVHTVATVHPETSKVRKIYGGLCHTFPILVMQCGLAQAVAFHEEKASVPLGTTPKPQHTAHQLLLEHYHAVLENSDLTQLSLTQYIYATRRVLAAWVFFKRFAVSILKVKAGEDTQV